MHSHRETTLARAGTILVVCLLPSPSAPYLPSRRILWTHMRSSPSPVQAIPPRSTTLSRLAMHATLTRPQSPRCPCSPGTSIRPQPLLQTRVLPGATLEQQPPRRIQALRLPTHLPRLVDSHSTLQPCPLHHWPRPTPRHRHPQPHHPSLSTTHRPLRSPCIVHHTRPVPRTVKLHPPPLCLMLGMGEDSMEHLPCSNNISSSNNISNSLHSDPTTSIPSSWPLTGELLSLRWHTRTSRMVKSMRSLHGKDSYGCLFEGTLQDYSWFFFPNDFGCDSRPRQTHNYPKVPTCNLYGPDSKVIEEWGYPAKLAMSKPPYRNHVLLSKYKLHLDESSGPHEPLPNGLTVVDAIADYLRLFHAHVVQVNEEKRRKTIRKRKRERPTASYAADC